MKAHKQKVVLNVTSTLTKGRLEESLLEWFHSEIDAGTLEMTFVSQTLPVVRLVPVVTDDGRSLGIAAQLNNRKPPAPPDHRIAKPITTDIHGL